MKKTGILISTAWLFMLFFQVNQAGSQTKSLSFEDFIRIRRVSDPQISPNSDLVAFVVTEMDKELNSSNSDIWILSLSGGEPWKLTSSPGADYRPRWSPDGKRIAFISTRGGSQQIWVIDPGRGEAHPVTRLSTGASGVIWSPTGKHLAFTSSVFPDCPDDECNTNRNEQKARSAVQAKIFDQLLFRHWNSWQDEKRSHLFITPSGGEKALDVTPGHYDTPPISLGSAHDYAFSPDGKNICFVRNTDPELNISLGTNNDLFITPIGGGAIRKITSNRANDNSPHYSPDGRYIAYRAMARPGFEADKYSLFLYDLNTQKKSNLTEKIDISVNDILWSPDSSALYVSFQDKGRISMARIPLKNMKFEKILSGHYISSPSITPDGKKLIFLNQAFNRPADIYSFDLRSEKIAPLTEMNTKILSEVEMNSAEEFWFDGAEGDKVHGFLVKPPSFDPSKKYPLVMLIHGGPQGAFSDNFHYRWNAQMFAAPGYVTALINFHGSTGYGQSFTDSITGDWGGKPYEDIMKGLDHLLSRYNFIDKNRLAAAGASYGGYMIDWIEGHTTRFSCLISHAGVYDLRSMHGATEELWFVEWEFKGTPWTNKEMYEKWSPSFFVQNFKTPCLVIHGQNDFRVPVTQGFQFFTALQRMNVPSHMLYFPDEDHFVQKPKNAELWWKTVHEWLAKYLK